MCTSSRSRGDCNKRGGRCQGTRCVGARRSSSSRKPSNYRRK